MSEESREARTKRILESPEFMDTVFAHVANGGTCITIANSFDIRFSDVMKYIVADDDRNKMYMDALACRVEWSKEKILAELRNIAHMDIRKIFTDTGALKPPSEWPDEVSSAVAGMDVAEIEEMMGGQKIPIGQLKKVKLESRTRAIELLGKNLTLFADKTIHEAGSSLEAIIALSNKVDKPK